MGGDGTLHDAMAEMTLLKNDRASRLRFWWVRDSDVAENTDLKRCALSARNDQYHGAMKRMAAGWTSQKADNLQLPKTVQLLNNIAVTRGPE